MCQTKLHENQLIFIILIKNNSFSFFNRAAWVAGVGSLVPALRMSVHRDHLPCGKECTFNILALKVIFNTYRIGERAAPKSRLQILPRRIHMQIHKRQATAKAAAAATTLPKNMPNNKEKKKQKAAAYPQKARCANSALPEIIIQML